MTFRLRRATTLVATGALAFALFAPAALAEDAPATDDADDPMALIEQLHDQGVGYGAIVKLTALASVLGMDALDMLEATPMVGDEYDFAFGEQRNALTPEQRADLMTQAEAYRELVEAAKADRADDEEDDEYELEDEEAELEDDGYDDDDTELEDEESELEDDGDEDMDEAKVLLIAEAFGMETDVVTQLRTDGYGWGALFRLAQLATAMNVEVDALLEMNDSGDGLALGKLRKMLDDEQLAALEAGPRNFGHLVAGKTEKPGKSDKAGKPDKADKSNRGNGKGNGRSGG